MTMVIGIHGGDFVLIGADSRSVQLANDGVTWVANDNEEKVFATGIGVMSGAGHWVSVALTRMHMMFAVEPGELAESLEEAFAEINQQRPDQTAGARRATHLMQSYLDPADAAVVLATIGPEDNYQEHRIARLEHTLLAPQGMTQQMEDDLTTRMRTAIANNLADNAVAWNIRAERAAVIIQDEMRTIGGLLHTISPGTFQLGLLDGRPQLRVSEITDAVANIRWRAAVVPHVGDVDDHAVADADHQ